MSLAIARGVVDILGLDSNPADLALWTGRGLRSGVGIRGFDQGGFLVDGGHAAHAESDVAPLLTRLDVPEQWRVVLITPPGEHGLSGAAERGAFERLGEDRQNAAAFEERTANVCRELLLGVLPALAEGDFDAFADALWSIQVHIGEAFSSVQGGRFASPQTTAIVEALRGLGAVATGQSSWGPTVFAFAPCEEDGVGWLATLRRQFGLAEVDGIVTRPRNSGARVRRLTSQALANFRDEAR